MKKVPHEQHAPGKNLSRRELLGRGIIGYSAWAAMPGLFALGARRAMADCGAISTNGALPFLVFDMAGGAALPGNFLVGKMGNNPAENMLASYDRLGWNPRSTNALYNDFGLPMARNSSKILAGMLATTTPEARAGLRLGGICHFAQDDSPNNKLNAAPLALRSGAYGRYVTNGLGIVPNASGGNSDSVLSDVALKPTFVRTIDDVIGAVTFGGSGLAGLTREQMRSMAQGALRLGQRQGDYARGSAAGDQLADLADCAYQKSVEFVDGVTGLDPRADADVAAVYGINANTSASDPNAMAAALTMNALRGTSGPGIWTLGGCDYHDGSQTTGDGKDQEMGQMIGRAVQTAFRLRKPLFFQLLTDGGCDASQGTRQWRGDSGDKCMTVVGYYDPNAPLAMRRQQVGYFTDGQSAERMTLVGSNPLLVGYAVFANYLACAGRLGEFEANAPGIFTGSGELDSVLLFQERSA